MLMDDLDQRLDASVQRRLQELRQQLALLTSQLKHAPGKGVYRAKDVLNALGGRLTRSVDAGLARQQQRLATLQATLQAAHPKRVLERGYTMIQDDKGRVLTAAASLQQGQTVNLQFADGRAAADIHTIEPEEDQP